MTPAQWNKLADEAIRLGQGPGRKGLTDSGHLDHTALRPIFDARFRHRGIDPDELDNLYSDPFCAGVLSARKPR